MYSKNAGFFFKEKRASIKYLTGNISKERIKLPESYS